MTPLRATFVPPLFEKIYGFGRFLISLLPDRQLIHLFHRQVPAQPHDETIEMSDFQDRHVFRSQDSSIESVYYKHFAQRESRKFFTLNEWMFERSDPETRDILSQFIRQWSYYLGKELMLDEVIVLSMNNDLPGVDELCIRLSLGEESYEVKIQKGTGKAHIFHGEMQVCLELDLFPSTEQVKQRIEKVICKQNLFEKAYQITALSACYLSLFELEHLNALCRDPATLLTGYQVLLQSGEQRFFMNLSASGCRFKLIELKR